MQMKTSTTILTAILTAGLFSLTADMETETAAKIVAEQKLPNQVRNGSFDSAQNNTSAPGWAFWKKDRAQGKVRYEKNIGVGQSPAAVISGGDGTLFGSAKIQGGETIYVRIKAKKIGTGDARLAVRFQKADRKWLPGEKFSANKSIVFSTDKEWTEVELVVKAPPHAKIAVPIFGVKNVGSPESQFIVDDVELYILPNPEK